MPIMGAAYFIGLECEIAALDTRMDGKSIAQHIESLDQAARDLDVRPLSEFVSVAPEQAADIIAGENVDLGDIELSPLRGH
jgi:hypothetical protein